MYRNRPPTTHRIHLFRGERIEKANGHADHEAVRSLCGRTESFGPFLYTEYGDLLDDEGVVCGRCIDLWEGMLRKNSATNTTTTTPPCDIPIEPAESERDRKNDSRE